MTAKFSLRVLSAMAMLFVLAALFGCQSGSSETTPDPNAKRPSITDLSTHSANIGDTLDVMGLNFGLSQSGGSVQLNGVDFLVNDWTDTKINITVAATMVSGIVVVTSNGLPSQSGPEAQLFIPAAPAGRPLINAVTPDFGYGGEQILITGSGFGNGAGGNVFFPAQAGAVSQDGGVVAAEIVSVEVDGTPVPQWGSSSIKCLIPDAAQYGKVLIYVEVNGQQSNEMPFTVYPKPDSGQPVIFDVVPPNGGPGTAITITGTNFGPVQGGSTLMLGDYALIVATWNDEEITAQVPSQAETADILLTKPGFSPANWGPFIVENSPVITGVSPSIIDIGDTFTVFGHDFGKQQGTGTLRVGGSSQSVDTWTDTKLVVNSLGTLPGSGELMTVVTNDAGLSSNEWPVYYQPPLEVRVTVNPQAGQRSGENGEPGTQFTFAVSVKGGSGNYDYYLIPNADNGSVEAPVSTTGTVNYTYPFEATAPDEEYITTQMRVVDKANNGSITADGPTVLVVNYGVPVITTMALSDFNRGVDINAPNDFCYLPSDKSYHDFSFVSGMPLLTSSKGSILSGGNPVPSYTRNLLNFMLGAANPRPYAYRYKDLPSSEVTVEGLNFGATQGQLFVNANDADDKLEIMSFNEWSDTTIRFNLPPLGQRMSGQVRVIPSGSEFEANSLRPLVCSPYVVQLLPTDVAYPVGAVTLSGFDFQPSSIADITGNKTYAIWIIKASYDNPWGGGTLTGTVLVTTPIEPTELVGTTMTLSLNDIDIDHNGTVPVEVFNTTGDQSQVVEGTPEDGQWFFFLWTGALAEGGNQIVANSGIFSEIYTINATSGPGPGGDPVADLQATPTNGDAPLLVNFDASGSTDDGTIDKYEFDFGEGGGFEDFGTTATASHTYNNEGTYTARLRVTDNDGNTDNDQVSINVGTTPGNQFQVGITINFGPWIQTDGVTRVRLHDSAPTGPTAPFTAQQFSGVPDDGVEQMVTFDDVADGQVWVSVFRIVTNWDSGDTDFGVYGPFTIPDTDVIHVVGDQYDEPPAPG
jgi:hypothetical protein